MRRSYLRIGVIPGGSTDALAYSLHGARDVVTAALHIVVGDDKVRTEEGSQLKIIFLSGRIHPVTFIRDTL